MKKRVLFITPSLVGAGAERVLCNIANNIDKTKFEIIVLIVLKADNRFLNLLSEDIRVIDLASTKQLKFNVLDILKAVKINNPDSVFVASGHLGLILSPFLFMFKKYNWLVRETNYVSLNVEGRLARLFYRIFYSGFDTIVAQCDDMASDLVESFKVTSDKIVTINNPVDTRFIDSRIDFNPSSDSYFCANKINLVACGRLTYQKGFDNLIKAFAKIEDKSKYHLSFIGEGEKNKRDVEYELKALVDELNLQEYVSFLGYKENVYPWLKSADVFILSSRFEGFSNVLLEAIYCGTPVLVNKCPGGVAEVVRADSIGELFSFEDENFEEKLKLICSKEYDVKLMKDFVIDNYGLEKIISKYEDLL